MSELARRQRAALAGYHDDEPTARAGLADADATVRAASLGALARLGRLDAMALQSAFGDESPLVRRRAAELTVTRPDVTVDPLLDDPDASVVEMAAWVCGERPGTDTVIEALVRLAAGHFDPLVREAAVAALGALEDERGLEAILSALDDKAPIRRRAVIALTPFDGARVAAAFARARQDRDLQVRQLAEQLGPDE